jgi:pimeloyl-ACP methyl ester carboxylesterase
MTKPGERWDDYRYTGTADHAGWAARSIGRRSWLFAFDYYVLAGTDARGSYTAGPGRIGSNTGFACSAPVGKGYLVPDSPSYDAEATHDYSADLASLIDDVLRATGATQVDVVAHSMGGLVLRSALAFHGASAKVARVVFLASPHLGVPLATVGSYFIGEPWMRAHELTELDEGSVFAKSKFTRCGSGADSDAWPKQLLAIETATPILAELHCMSGTHDILVSHDSAHHPQCVDHLDVDGVDHTGLLHSEVTSDRVRLLTGGFYSPAPR